MRYGQPDRQTTYERHIVQMFDDLTVG